jgi:hypothetical protein
MVMGVEAKQFSQESNVDKTVEVARIVFQIATPVTVVEAEGRATLRIPPQSNLDTTNMVDAVTEALNGLVQDTAGAEFGVAQVQIQASGSIEIIAVIVATYLAVKQVMDVVDTLQKVARLGRWLVQAVLRAQPMQADSVHARVDINPAMAASDRAGTTRGNAPGATGLAFTLTSLISTRGPLLLVILNLLIAGAILAVVLTR